MCIRDRIDADRVDLFGGFDHFGNNAGHRLDLGQGYAHGNDFGGQGVFGIGQRLTALCLGQKVFQFCLCLLYTSRCV